MPQFIRSIAIHSMRTAYCFRPFRLLDIPITRTVFAPEFIVTTQHIQAMLLHFLLPPNFLSHNDNANIVPINLFINLPIEAKMTSNRFLTRSHHLLSKIVISVFFLLQCVAHMY